tara:strand:- start:911 stop:1372 length:462 start_codon:yes stop_codon:yes gene_type:complete
MSVFDSGRNRFAAGIGSVGSYQVAGVPWITGSITLAHTVTDKITFPTIAKSVTVCNMDGIDGVDDGVSLQVHFNSTSDGDVIGGKHFVPLWADRQSIKVFTKCKEIYVTNYGRASDGADLGVGKYYVFAELTGIQANEMFSLTGSGLTTIDGT